MVNHVSKILRLDLQDYTRLFYYRRGTNFQTVLYLLLLAGMTPAEAAALHWKDVNFSNGCIHTPENTYSMVKSVFDHMKFERMCQLEAHYEAGTLSTFGQVCYQDDGMPYTGEAMDLAFRNYLVERGNPPMSAKEVRESFPEYLYENDLVVPIINMYLINSRLERTPLQML
ncbi:MAG: hypothetical protein MR637_03590 [Clostridiales bacterium]|nr:hypothetical protein [Clostridiales bacterium]